MIDTHTHLYMTDSFPDGGKEAVEKALEAGISKLVFPGVSLPSVASQIALHDLYPENTYLAAGLHPTEVGEDWKREIQDIFQAFEGKRIIAVGEVGVDLYWDKSNRSRQMDAFGHQLDIAYKLGLPVIIHSRNAIEETIEIARSMGHDCPRLLFHSFTSGRRDAEKILENFEDSLLGFNGVITFKNGAEVREAAAFVGLDKIVSETDAPYLSPVPFRGTTNDSSRIPVIIDAIASACGEPVEKARQKLRENAETFFRI